ncbi:MAG TPA: hypothetical protein VNH84_15895, partial [Candidatus Saccharimonadales bacterium]|nr:hypothetical protein [Candidatus Saccharimonadales bacterium]
MNTPLLRTTGLAVLALLCPARLATAQQDFSKVEIKTTAVAGNIQGQRDLLHRLESGAHGRSVLQRQVSLRR